MEYFYNNFMDSFSADEDRYEDETVIMKAILAYAERAEEHVLNKGLRTSNRTLAR